MRKISFIWIGKLKKGWWKEAAEHYIKRLTPHFPIKQTVLKDAPGHLPPEEKKLWEGKKILEKIGPGDFPVVMDEHGKTMTSPQLSKKLITWTEDPATSPCFIVGGAYGLSDAVLAACRFKLALSSMTFPHEMARVILLEQLYRAAAIAKGSPYHH
ncbi:23S rRNA (pseudouridine(1915)-N(3))-methyltransferase RlmH [Desulfovibrio ferrophilus]|uniref:Ribosomal RNA large subunit methyltransferase H n=1 Tax=Desulfovibrio ferrophilus TaxID=241368 RepID=A0A2Z6AVR1_9BACT|nr:23S rRNA (pseudouridine(1915)-N(3))-methyltransferase RlmH [Desulfovibrio ferrophilus]BBD07303.1 ribosomal RNA large subunit methyltransferase H [Desulfovibrio ferrophilus]